VAENVICAKALAKEPEDRLAAQEFVEDGGDGGTGGRSCRDRLGEKLWRWRGSIVLTAALLGITFVLLVLRAVLFRASKRRGELFVRTGRARE
jgi:hypothetical protein